MKPALLLLALTLPASVAAAQATPTASYSVTFEATWSALTHPTEFPVGPHFSGLVGAVHDASVDLWEPGQLASTGIERMAELGVKTQLLDEVAAFGGAASQLSGGGIGTSPGDVSLAFTIDTARPLVSLVSMVAPSPDWFVGVDALPLLVDGDWLPCQAIELVGWDAGTDSGVSYLSANADSVPAQPITLLGAPLTPGVSLGRFVFTRTDVPPVQPWVDLGAALAGGLGAPVLEASGTLCPGTPLTLTLAGALPSTSAFLCVGVAELGLAFHGGVLVPDITTAPGFFIGLPTDGVGALVMAETWPPGLPAGVPLYLQVWQPDAGAPLGFAASNALRGETP